MKTGTLTLSKRHFNEILDNVNHDFLIFIIVEAIRNLIYTKQEEGFQLYYDPLNDTNVTTGDMFSQSMVYLMDVVEANDPLFDTDDLEAFNAVSETVADRLMLVMTEMETDNRYELLDPYKDSLFDILGNPLYPSVSGTFLGNKVLLCFY